MTQADADAAGFTNTATVTGTPPAGLTPPTDSDSAESPVDPVPELTLVKSADPVTEGDEIVYTFAVTNSGNVTLTDVTVSDPLPGLSLIDCGDGDPVTDSFAPGGPVTCTATYAMCEAPVIIACTL